ncbi:hypothetical protein C5167_028863 [Papaver somniferum]|nr:hypothetical protein C5167_028863 [Papaver somniferum]
MAKSIEILYMKLLLPTDQENHLRISQELASEPSWCRESFVGCDLHLRKKDSRRLLQPFVWKPAAWLQRLHALGRAKLGFWRRGQEIAGSCHMLGGELVRLRYASQMEG